MNQYEKLFEAYTKDFSIKYAARDALIQLDKLDCVKALRTCEYFVELMRLKCDETRRELMGLGVGVKQGLQAGVKS